jgi:nucleoside 2-deoxyribosyltransferase
VSNSPIRYRYFNAGELFSIKHLAGNVDLAEAISTESKGRYSAILPQDLEVDASRGAAIRDADLLALLSADLALFNFDGPELDSGTVVEFVFAKFADIPAVLLRTDFRRGGDSHSDPWNLMVSDWPRTEKVIIHAMELYHSARPGERQDSLRFAVHEVACKVIEAFDRVAKQPSALPADLRGEVYRWLSLVPGFGLERREIDGIFREILSTKIKRGLL